MVVNILKNSELKENLRWDGAGFPKRLERAKAGLSTNAFALKCGISESVFRKYLAGSSVPGADKLVDIARVAEVSLLWLATGEGHADDQRAGAKTSTPLDTTLLETIIESVETGLKEIQGELTPAKKAKLIAVIYGLYQSGDTARKAPVLELVKLAM